MILAVTEQHHDRSNDYNPHEFYFLDTNKLKSVNPVDAKVLEAIKLNSTSNILKVKVDVGETDIEKWSKIKISNKAKMKSGLAEKILYLNIHFM